MPEYDPNSLNPEAASSEADAARLEERLRFLLDKEKNPDLYVNERLSKTLDAVAAGIGIEPHTIYYPSSSTDITLERTFPDARVIHVDIDEHSVAALEEQGMEAVHTSALEFEPDTPIDMLFMLNPQIDPAVPLAQLVVDGYAIVNNYHLTADELNKMSSMKLIGVMSQLGATDLITEGADSWLGHQAVTHTVKLQTGSHTTELLHANHPDALFVFQKVSSPDS